MGEKEFIIFVTVLIILLLTGTMIALFVLFTRRKNQLFREKEIIRAEFNLELTNASIEIREETLRNISWELHDNIGQLITLAKIQTQQIEDNPTKVNEVKSTITHALSELRSLSKSINPDVIKQLDMIGAIQQEVDRFNRLEYINAILEIKGAIFKLDSSKEIILFRILQEFFTNTLKHAKASELNILLDYQDKYIDLEIKDNGKGFIISMETDGIGLSNMENRAKLINATFCIESNQDIGTILRMKVLK